MISKSSAMASLISLLVWFIHITGTVSSVLPDESQPSTTCNSCCQGQAGLSGVPGSAGIPGSNGLPGRDGLRGETGLRGEAGQRGPVGNDGPPCPLGPVTEPAEKGDPGLQGLPGKVGPRGLEGRAGANGSHGLDGAVGLKGSRGEPGGSPELRRSAFSVFKTSHQIGNTGNVLTFQQEEINLGSHFSTSTSKFTCQTPGTYVFMFTIFSNRDAHDPCIDLVIDDRLVARVNVYTVGQNSASSANNHYQFSNSAIVQLSIGNQVWLKYCRNIEQVYGSGRYTSFSGFLLYAE